MQSPVVVVVPSGEERVVFRSEMVRVRRDAQHITFPRGRHRHALWPWILHDLPLCFTLDARRVT